MVEQQGRQTAYKAWISDLINNEYVIQNGEWEPNYVKIRDKKVTRVNLIAIVVDKYDNEDGTYSSLTVDDSSDNITLRAWKEDIQILKEVNIGDIVLIIGKIKEYERSRYIIPEIVKQVDNPKWVELRKLELNKEYGAPSDSKQEVKPPQKEESNPEQPKIEEESLVEDSPEEEALGEGDRQKILNLIEKDESEEGADIIKIIEESGLEEESANSLIQELLKEGEIFEIKQGKVKIIE